MDNIKVNIHGSCVTRDAFEVCEHSFEVGEYISRNSIFSAVSDRMEIDKEINKVIEVLKPWEQKCLYTDINKITFERLEKSNAKIILLDLIDERHSLVLGAKNCFVTNSVYFKDAKLVEYIKNIVGIRDASSFDDELIESVLYKYKTELLKIYDVKNIVINEAYCVEFYRSRTGEIVKFSEQELKSIHHTNLKLQKMYKLLESYLEGCHIIQMLPETLADEQHKWGLAPFHYEKEFYLNVMDYLTRNFR